MSNMDSFAENRLRTLSDISQMRRTTTIENVSGPYITIAGKSYLCFCSNDYLGIAQHPAVIKSATEAAIEYGWGTGSSRLLSGTTLWHQRLEERISSFKQTESTLLFMTGYMANLGLVTSLADAETLIVADELNHASMIDGCRMSKGTIQIYRHRNVQDATEKLIQGSAYKHKIIVSDAVFSMDGDLAPIKELIAIAQEHNAECIIDDAHGFGILGAHGRGTLEYLNAENDVRISTATLSKTAGSTGGFITGPQHMMNLICNQARSFIFTTSCAPAVCAAAIAGIDLIEKGNDLRTQLWKNVTFFRDALHEMEFDTKDSETAIIPVIMGTNENALQAAQLLQDNNIFTPAIRPPTVPEGQSRLRFSITAMHTQEQLDQTISVMKQIRNFV